MEINFFDKYVLRVPLLSLNNLESINEFSIIKIFKDSKLLQEALYLSSPELFYEVKKGIENEKLDEKKILTLSKFLIRSSSKCTPFGLFAGISVGNLKNTDLKKIEIGDISSHQRTTKFDMKFLCQLYGNIMSKYDARYKMTYTTNNSIYQVGNKYRYVEYKYSDGEKSHFITSVEYSEYLEKIFNACKNGLKFENLIIEIYEFDNSLNKQEIIDFVNELIDSQLIVSEIYPSVIGEDYFEILSPYISNSKTLKAILNKIDNSLDGKETLNLYKEMYSEIDKMGISYNRKYLFKTDLLTTVNSNYLNSSNINNIKDVIRLVLTSVDINEKNDRLENFKKRFYDRFEEREVPISIALDTELGITYDESYSYEKSFLTQDIYLPQKNDEPKQTELDKFIKNTFKLNNYLVTSNYEIKLDEVPFMPSEDEEKIKRLLPKTFNVFSSIFIDENKNPVIVIDGIGGDSSTSLLGRFSHINNKMLNFIKEISKKEEDLYQDAIVAEIVHLPNDRAGNILYRKDFRNFEIPYLSLGSVERGNQILMEDLVIAVRGGKLVLKSKKHKKIIKPVLSSSQNYDFNSLPIYKFLCDMQSQDSIRSFKFGKNVIKNQTFYPRLKYKNIILSLAQWHFKQDELLQHIEDDFKKLKKEMNIPDTIIFSTQSDDSYLILDLKNDLQLEVFFDEVRKRKGDMIIIKEKLDLEPITNCGEQFFNNEFIFSAFME